MSDEPDYSSYIETLAIAGYRAEIARLKEVVRAADAMRGEFEVDIITGWQVSDCEMPEDYLSGYDAIHAYDAARAKVTI